MPGPSVSVFFTLTPFFSKICWQISALYEHITKKSKGQFSCGCFWGTQGESQMLWREYQALHLHLCDLLPGDRQLPPTPHCSPLSPSTHMPFQFPQQPKCDRSSSALSALEVTGDKAPATAKDEALLQLLPQRCPLFLSPWPQRQPKWQNPGSSLLDSPSSLSLSSSALIYCICKAFLRGFLHQLGRGRGERGGEGRQDKRVAIKVENLGKPWEQGCVGKRGCKMQGSSGHGTAVQELQGERGRMSAGSSWWDLKM